MKKKHLLSISIVTVLTLLVVHPFGSATDENATNLVLTDLTGTTHGFTYAQLFDMPKTEVIADLYCDGALVTYGSWGGVSLNFLLNQTQLNPDAQSIEFTAIDGYQVAIPLELAIEPQIIIAYELNAHPLAEGLRLVIPDANGAAWIAKISTITMSIYGAPYPQAISVGHIGGQNVAPTQTESTPKPSPTQQEIPVQPQPSTLQNSSSIIQEATPTNVTQPNAATSRPVSNQSSSLPDMLYLVVFACTILFTGAVFMVFRKKNQLKARFESVSESE